MTGRLTAEADDHATVNSTLREELLATTKRLAEERTSALKAAKNAEQRDEEIKKLISKQKQCTNDLKKAKKEIKARDRNALALT